MIQERKFRFSSFFIIQQLKSIEMWENVLIELIHSSWYYFKDVISQIGDLWMLWTDLQKDFTEHMKDFRHHFEMILEGEKGVDNARNNLDVAEAKETKYRKELKKLRKKSSGGDGESHEALEAKVRMAEKERDSSQVGTMLFNGGLYRIDALTATLLLAENFEMLRYLHRLHNRSFLLSPS